MARRYFVTLFFTGLLFVTNLLSAQTERVEASTGFPSSSLDSIRINNNFGGSLRLGDNLEREFVLVDVFSRHDPLNPVDTTLEPSARWYSFILTGVKDKAVLMQFHHSEAQRPFYAYIDGGMPQPEDFRRFPQEHIMGADRVLGCFDRDSVMISYFIPYTYEYLQERIRQWSESGKVKVGSAGRSTEGRDMPLLKITDFSVPDEEKKSVYMHARTHTSEAPCSWHLDFLISRLLDENNAHSREMLKSIVFHIVPFANPDGVVNGLSRSNVTGVNQEINWDKAADSTVQEVKNLKQVLDSLYAVQHVDMSLNLHSQISPYATYWVHTAESTSESFFRDEMRLANLTAYNNIYMYPEDFSYSSVAPRYVEGWIWNRVGEKTMAITFETTYVHFSQNPEDEDSEFPEVSLESLKGLAEHSVMAIGDYFRISTPQRKLMEPRRRLKLEGGRTYRISALLEDGTGGWIPLTEFYCEKDGKKRIRLPENCETLMVEIL